MPGFLEIASITSGVSKIVGDLFNNYKKRKRDGELSKDLVPTTQELTKALIRLSNAGYLEKMGLDLSEIADEDDVEDIKEVLKKIERATELYQKTFEQLQADGIIGKRTANMLNSPGCCGKLNTETAEQPLDKNFGPDRRLIRYFVLKDDDGKLSLPSVPTREDALTLLEQAWMAWAKHAIINIMPATHPEGANVIVKTQLLDHQGGDLADAHVGPPWGHVLELRFDLAEAWDRRKFLYAATHEIGHILGLGHSATPGQIMNPKLNFDIIEPKDEDIERIQHLWGKRVPVEFDMSDVIVG